jgi:hypothetical protein
MPSPQCIGVFVITLASEQEGRVSIKYTERQLEVEDLARTKWITGTGLASCNPQTWVGWLADDVVLSFRMGAVGTSTISKLQGYSCVFRGAGKRECRRLLNSVLDGLAEQLSITAEIIAGSHIILLGRLLQRKPEGDAERMPIVIYMALNWDKKIQSMTIAIDDMQTIATAIGFHD